MDDGLIQKILVKSLGDRFSRFATADPPDSIGPLDAFESILYCLDKRDLIRILEGIQAFSTIVSPRIALHTLVEKIAEIMKFNVMITPALVVDGQVKSAGKVLSVDDIKKCLM